MEPYKIDLNKYEIITIIRIKVKMSSYMLTEAHAVFPHMMHTYI